MGSLCRQSVKVREGNITTDNKGSKCVHDGETNHHAGYAITNTGSVCLLAMLEIEFPPTVGGVPYPLLPEEVEVRYRFAGDNQEEEAALPPTR